MKTKTILPLLATVMTAHPVGAAITYVDAVTGNTTLADGSPHAPVGTIAAINDDWDGRLFGNGGLVYESNGASGATREDAPRIRTTLTLAAGEQYDVYAYFWGVATGNWRGRASLENPAGELSGYNTRHTAASTFGPMQGLAPDAAVGVGPATLGLSIDENGFENGGYFTNSVLIAEGDRTLFQVYLGTATADENGLIHIYIDDLENTPNTNRTWYDGVGYELIPEPSVALLGTFGLPALLRRRRA